MFLSTDLVLKAYEKGIFPMSDSNNDPYIYWVEPKERGVIDLKEFKISKSLTKLIKKETHAIEINSNFEKVINLCAKNKKKYVLLDSNNSTPAENLNRIIKEFKKIAK